MDLLLTPSIFIDYLQNISKYPKSEFELDLSALINNPSNRFVISKDLIKFLEKNKHGPFESVLLPFLTHIINSQAIVVASTGGKNENEIVNSVAKSYEGHESSKKKDVFLTVAKTKINENTSTVDLSNLKRPNKDWALFKLSCHHPTPVVLRYYDFKNNVEIESIIKSLFNVVMSTKPYYILDRQCSFGHKLFDSFRKTELVHYYTTFRTINDNSDLFRRFFGNLKTFGAKPSFIHERKVFRESMIVEVDDDFPNIEVQRTTWKMDITYCIKTSAGLQKKVKPFERILIR